MIANQSSHRKGRKKKREKSDVDQTLLDVARVTRVVGGGRRFSFRAAVAVGNRKGRVGFGVAKGSDVSTAVDKAVNKAKKHMVDVPVVRGTIPHDTHVKLGSARIYLRPARQGAGIIAGGAVRALSDLAGIQNIVGKIHGTSNVVNNAYATIEAFRHLEGKRSIFRRRNIVIHEKLEETKEKLKNDTQIKKESLSAVAKPQQQQREKDSQNIPSKAVQQEA